MEASKELLRTFFRQFQQQESKRRLQAMKTKRASGFFRKFCRKIILSCYMSVIDLTYSASLALDIDLFLAAFLWTSTLSVELGKSLPVMPLVLVNKTYIIILDWLPYGRFSYDEYDVPDTMNVHGIYDTSATMQTSESRREFQKYLQQEAGVSESYFGYYAGAKKAWGSSESGAKQQYMSVLDVDVDRWVPEISPTNNSNNMSREKFYSFLGEQNIQTANKQKYCVLLN